MKDCEEPIKGMCRTYKRIVKVLSKLYDNPVAAEAALPGLLVQASSDTTTDAVGKIIDNV